EGIYAGKGIYDPLALTHILKNRFPDDALLNHDLIERNYARAAFLSDIELLDNYPATYAAFAARQHRWTRGDWQIAPWLLPRVRTRHGFETNPLPVIARFQIFDNLRRSLVAPASLLALTVGLTGFSGRAVVWVAGALSPFAVARLLALLDRLVATPGSPNPRGALRVLRDELRLEAARFAIDVAFLPDVAVTNVDAIVRTLYRLGGSRRDLLEWETAEQAERRGGQSSRRLLRHAVPAAIVALLGVLAARRSNAAAADARRRASDPSPALPLAGGWLIAPAVAAWLDRPPPRRTLPAGPAEP